LHKFVKPERNTQFSNKNHVKITLIMVEEMIDDINMKVVELNLAYKIKFCVLMVNDELIKSMDWMAFKLVINNRDSM
jgi:hypothetical protein